MDEQYNTVQDFQNACINIELPTLIILGLNDINETIIACFTTARWAPDDRHHYCEKSFLCNLTKEICFPLRSTSYNYAIKCDINCGP